MPCHSAARLGQYGRTKRQSDGRSRDTRKRPEKAGPMIRSQAPTVTFGMKRPVRTIKAGSWNRLNAIDVSLASHGFAAGAATCITACNVVNDALGVSDYLLSEGGAP